MANTKTLNQKRLDADVRSSRWLSDGNDAREAGNKEKAEECYRKAQFWLDRRIELEERMYAAGHNKSLGQA